MGIIATPYFGDSSFDHVRAFIFRGGIFVAFPFPSEERQNFELGQIYLFSSFRVIHSTSHPPPLSMVHNICISQYFIGKYLNISVPPETTQRIHRIDDLT